MAELVKHRIVLQVVDEAAAKEAFESMFPGFTQREIVAMKTNVQAPTTGLSPTARESACFPHMPVRSAGG